MSSVEPTVRRSAVPWWNELFPARGDANPPRLTRFRVLRRGGQPFLVLPTSPRLAAMGLQLYPAQRGPARVASRGLKLLLRGGLPVPTPQATLPLWPDDPLIRFLATLANRGTSGDEIPLFAVLAGNPSAAGRRFGPLVWKPDGEPAGVVKAGVGPEARGLIEHEEEFLRRISGTKPGVPQVLDSMSSDAIRAFALPFVAGRNPPLEPTRAVEELLAHWIIADKVRATEVKQWNVLRTTCSADAAFERLARRIEENEFASVIAHGDFAPWNLRVQTDSDCTALDWERGALPGMPGWDWFHYVIQSALLVRRSGIPSVRNRLEALLASATFRNYAHRAGIEGREKVFLLAYLHHVVRVLRPTEGMPAARELLECVTGAWAEAH